MDWNLAIERNRKALRRVLAMLVAMAGLGQSAVGSGQSDSAAKPDCLLPTADCPHPEVRAEDEPRRTLSRHLHRAVLRLLRPAESAARRLIIVAARGLVVELPRARPRKPKPDAKAGHAALRGLGIAVVISGAMAPATAGRRAAAMRAAARAGRRLALPLVDPLPRLLSLSKGRRTIPQHAAPRILSFDGTPPHRLPPPPSHDDPIDASRLALRLAALASALDDLPAQARRFARWKARRDRGRETGRFRRLSPLRPGRPPGQRSANSRRPVHEIHDVLGDLQWFAFKALERPDTS